MLTFDTLWYHGPFAARIADTGSVWGMHFTDPLYLNWFYPQNSELLHAAGIVLFDRDLFSPADQLRLARSGAARRPGASAAPTASRPLSWSPSASPWTPARWSPARPARPATDTVPVALLLAAAAILINAWASAPAGSPDRPSAAPRMLSAPSWSPAWPRDRAGQQADDRRRDRRGIADRACRSSSPASVRWKAFWIFVGGVAAVAGFWFLRNLIHAGNPLPWVRHLGPIDLPGPNRGLEGRDDFTVAHYIFSDPAPASGAPTSSTRSTNLLGPLWFLILGGAAGGAVLAIWRPRIGGGAAGWAPSRRRRDRLPLHPADGGGARGPPARLRDQPPLPDPGLALGLALLPLEPRLSRVSGCGLPLLAGGLIALCFTSLYSDANVAWEGAFASIPWAAVIGAGADRRAGRRSPLLARRRGALVAGPPAPCWRSPSRPSAGSARTTTSPTATTAPRTSASSSTSAVRWAKPTSGLRIAVAGTSGAYNQYGFYGDDVSNYVQYVGPATSRRRTSGRSRGARRSGAAVNDGDYDYLVTTPELDLNHPVDGERLARAGLDRGRSGRRGAAPLRSGLGLPDRRQLSTRRLREAGEPARGPGQPGPSASQR